MTNKIYNSRYFKKYLKYKIKYLELSGGTLKGVYVTLYHTHNDNSDNQPIFTILYYGIKKYLKYDGKGSFYEVNINTQP